MVLGAVGSGREVRAMLRRRHSGALSQGVNALGLALSDSLWLLVEKGLWVWCQRGDQLGSRRELELEDSEMLDPT